MTNHELGPISTPHPSYWQSWAEWPAGLVNNVSGEGRNCTLESHETREQAFAVCKMLQRDGFKGERRHFPLKTWVVEVPVSVF